MDRMVIAVRADSRGAHHMIEDAEDRSGAEPRRNAHKVTWFSAERPVSGTVSLRKPDDARGQDSGVVEDLPD